MKNSKFEARNPKQIRNLSDDSQDSNARILKTYCFGHLNFGHSILFRISPAEGGSDRNPALLGDIRISYALLLLCSCAWLYFIAGCESTNTKIPLADQIQTLRQEKRELTRQIEQSKLENKDLKKQIQVLSGLPPEVKPENLYRLQSIKIAKYTNFYDKDKDGNKEKLIVYIQPLDEDGDIIKAIGAVDVRLRDPNENTSQEPIGQWHVEPNQLKKLWLPTFISTNYKLTFDVADKIESLEEPLTVKVSFTDYLTGKVFNEEKLIRIVDKKQ